MSLPLLSLVGFSVWTMLVLVAGVGTYRWSRILAGTSRLSDFPADVPHGPDRYRRIVRAHANCIENLPVFAALVLTAEALGLRSAAFSWMCAAAVLARVAQTTTHVASGSGRAIAIRFLFFSMQQATFLAMAATLLMNRATP